jgi:hypothetical protein
MTIWLRSRSTAQPSNTWGDRARELMAQFVPANLADTPRPG